MYAGSHEWVKVDGKTAIVGITNHAQDYLGDAVYVELPEVGAVESAKATSDVYYLVSGDMVKVNEELNNSHDDVELGLFRVWIGFAELLMWVRVFKISSVDDVVVMAVCLDRVFGFFRFLLVALSRFLIDLRI
ncbi:hypothetical protein DKX38_003964 [Salix brachista]|uniref:Glycine cleavage system H protein n=1 Tax=Salix brachista TaxID=2182728 RepID=A0A5N5N8X1_9ROSI|nr:hypothetical protein DKX38_003964 [Salix brachista]